MLKITVDKKKQNENKKQIIERLIFDRPYIFFKSNYNPIMPLNIYQTWKTKELPPAMQSRVEILKKQNPRFNHYLFDDNDCSEFIKNNFDNSVLDAYNRLIPGAYKADLWRLCILYKWGGIYLDIKLNCINGFKLIELTEQNHYVKDRPHKSIFNSLMASASGNEFLLKGIYKIVENVKKRYYGGCPLSPTGPIMLGSLISNNQIKNIDLNHYKYGGYICYKKRFIISTEYPEYDSERRNTYNIHNTKRYDELWKERNIYK